MEMNRKSVNCNEIRLSASESLSVIQSLASQLIGECDEDTMRLVDEQNGKYYELCVHQPCDCCPDNNEGCDNCGTDDHAPGEKWCQECLDKYCPDCAELLDDCYCDDDYSPDHNDDDVCYNCGEEYGACDCMCPVCVQPYDCCDCICDERGEFHKVVTKGLGNLNAFERAKLLKE